MHEHHGLQCGYCTPGILMTMTAFLKEHPSPSEDEVREALSGNLCRCTGYQNIVDAMLACGASDAGCHAMTTRFFGAPVKRNEDKKLLTGQALFIDDVELPGMLHVAFLRSQVAHAQNQADRRLVALKRPGVVAVYTADDLGAYWQPGPLLVPPPPIAGIVFNPRTQGAACQGQGPACRRADCDRGRRKPLHRRGRARRYRGRSARRCLAVVDLERPCKRTPRIVHDDLGSNIAAHVHQTKGDYAKAAAKADLILKRRFRYEHGISSPIETRGVVAQWNARAEQMTVWDTTQAPVFVRNGLAGMLGLGERQVRVIAPFVGGGFGPKIMMFYPEEVALPWIVDAAQSAGKMDRGPAGAFLRHHA